MKYVVVRQKRNPVVSVAKAIGIILMVVGHVYDKKSMGIHYIYMFHMPLFFVLSGFFFKAPQNFSDLVKFTKKKVLVLYRPFLSWTAVFILLHNVLLDFGIGDNVYNFHAAFSCFCKSALSFYTTEKVLVGFWFFKTLFSASLFLACVFFVTRKMRLGIIYVAILSLLLVSGLIALGFNNRMLLGMLYGTFFLCVGFCLRKWNIVERCMGIQWMLLCACMVFVLSRIYVEVSNTEMLAVDRTTFLPFAFSGVCGSIMVVLFSQRITEVNSSGILRLLVYIGDHTIVVLALHYPLIKIFGFFFMKNIEGFSSTRHILGVLIGVLTPVALNKLYAIVKSKVL